MQVDWIVSNHASFAAAVIAAGAAAAGLVARRRRVPVARAPRTVASPPAPPSPDDPWVWPAAEIERFATTPTRFARR